MQLIPEYTPNFGGRYHSVYVCPVTDGHTTTGSVFRCRKTVVTSPDMSGIQGQDALVKCHFCTSEIEKN